MSWIRRQFAAYRRQAAIVLLAGIALYADLNLAAEMIKGYRNTRKSDVVTACETRMLPLKDALAGTREVGYITTVDSDKIFSREKTFEDVEVLAHYILTQYILAPVVVRNSPDYPLVVGNFTEGKPDPAVIREKRLIPVRDYGDGLVLYRKETPR